jgi:hypothetical protein
MTEAHKETFGSCCEDLRDALNSDFESFFRVEDSGVLYLTVGYVPTDEGPGFFDAAVIFCPFCGQRLQEEQEIAQRSVQ